MAHLLNHEKQISEFEQTLLRLRSHQKTTDVLVNQEIEDIEEKLLDLKMRIYSKLTPWERVTICRHPERPHAIDYIKMIASSFHELSGDRLYREDSAIIGGLALIDGQKFMIIAQEKGHDTESRIKHNFGMPHPEGYRKAQRLMKMAEKFSIPVLCLIDTPGAQPTLEAEERGQGRAIADNLFVMSRLKTPVIVVVIGEGCSGGAIGIGVGDQIAMMEHSYYSVISPEGCASILWKNAAMKETAAKALKLQAEDLLQFKVIDTIIKEPLGGAHHDKAKAAQNLKTFVLSTYANLSKIDIKDLLKKRYEKFRAMGNHG